MSIWWTLQLRRDAASVPLARRLLLGTMETAGVESDIAYELSVALSEACANAVEHGGGAEHDEDYRVTAYLNGDMCRIEVTDHGPGFPVESPVPAVAGSRARTASGASETGLAGTGGALAGEAVGEQESGRGLFLIRALADHVRFRSQPGSGACVSFDKILKWREDALLKAV
ncbi:ATP-binding protein [Streptomyces sp. 549]|uniref:ATP-binding protein n=1 Tax=Streptomyces sp. 549 TaxID=3049076 RepID=UPI0024C2ED68|nr:ATP-binding protein [Streptomyces sp. 549]MDK1474975.1 ATP-binding protein [Streptomyces sp. 549]